MYKKQTTTIIDAINAVDSTESCRLCRNIADTTPIDRLIIANPTKNVVRFMTYIYKITFMKY
jgi:hypothetical protein